MFVVKFQVSPNTKPTSLEARSEILAKCGKVLQLRPSQAKQAEDLLAWMDLLAKENACQMSFMFLLHEALVTSQPSWTYKRFRSCGECGRLFSLGCDTCRMSTS